MAEESRKNDKNKKDKGPERKPGPAPEMPKASAASAAETPDVDSLLKAAESSLDELATDLGTGTDRNATEGTSPTPSTADTASGDKVAQVDQTLNNLEKDLELLTKEIDGGKQPVAAKVDEREEIINSLPDLPGTETAEESIDDTLSQLANEIEGINEATVPQGASTPVVETPAEDLNSANNVSNQEIEQLLQQAEQNIIAEEPAPANSLSTPTETPAEPLPPSPNAIEAVDSPTEEAAQAATEKHRERAVVEEIKVTVPAETKVQASTQPKNTTPVPAQTQPIAADNNPAPSEMPSGETAEATIAANTDETEGQPGFMHRSLTQIFTVLDKPFSFLSDEAKDVIGIVAVVTCFITMLGTALVLLFK